MKNKFLVLLKADLKALTIGRFRLNKKAKAKNIAILLGLLGLAVYLIFTITQSFKAVFEISLQMDLIEMGFMYGGMMAFGFVFIQAMSESQDKLYRAKDLNTLLTLPVKEKYIFLSKSIAILLSGYIYFSMVYISLIVSYFLVVGFSITALVVSIIMFFLFPLLPFGLGLLFGKMVSKITVNTKQRGLVSGLIYFVIFIVLMAAMMVFQFAPSYMMESNVIYTILKVVFYRSFLMSAAMGGNFVSLLLVALISIFIGVLLLYFASINYLKISRSFGEQNFKAKNMQYKRSSVTRALLKKETRRYLSSSIYIFNTYFGMIILIVGCIAMMFVSPAKVPLTPGLLVTIISFIVAMSCTTSASISLEGQSFYTLKSLPINLKTWLNTKSIFNILIVSPIAVMACAFLMIKFSAAWYLILLGCSYLVIINVLVAEFGLFANILFPKLDFQDDTGAVKRSMSVLLAVFALIALIAVLEGLSGLFKALWIVLMLKAVIALVLAVVFFTLNRTYGTTKMQKI